MMNVLLNISINRFLEEITKKYAAEIAVKYTEVVFELTYEKLDKEADKIAKGLLGMGLRKGDHIAVWATNRPEWILLFLAAAKTGLILTPINTNFKARELRYILKQSDCRALFLSNGVRDVDYIKIINNLCPEIESSKPGMLASKKLPLLKFAVSFDEHPAGMYHWSQMEEFGNLISDDEFRKSKSSVLPDDIVCIIYTSAVNGYLKGAVLTQSQLLNNGYAAGELYKYTPADKVCVALPFFHCFGLVFGIFSTLSHGAAIIPLIGLSPVKAMNAVEKAECTTIVSVPTLFFAIINHEDFKKYNLSSLRKGGIGGAHCPSQLFDQLTKKMNMSKFVNGYGLTECTPICTMSSIDAPYEKRRDTVGVAMPFAEIKIIHPETGLELSAEEHGELCVRGYNVMKGYYKMPEETEKTIDKDGWLHTGDIAAVDQDGYYKITGRLKDMIIRGGENIYPKELEDFIRQHPAIKDVRIVAAPSEIYGEEAFAFIVSEKDASITIKDIKLYVTQNMARYKVPSHVVFIDQMPMDIDEKIDDLKLSKMVREHLCIDSLKS